MVDALINSSRRVRGRVWRAVWPEPTCRAASQILDESILSRDCIGFLQVRPAALEKVPPAGCLMARFSLTTRLRTL